MGGGEWSSIWTGFVSPDSIERSTPGDEKFGYFSPLFIRNRAEKRRTETILVTTVFLLQNGSHHSNVETIDFFGGGGQLSTLTSASCRGGRHCLVLGALMRGIPFLWGGGGKRGALFLLLFLWPKKHVESRSSILKTGKSKTLDVPIDGREAKSTGPFARKGAAAFRIAAVRGTVGGAIVSVVDGGGRGEGGGGGEGSNTTKRMRGGEWWEVERRETEGVVSDAGNGGRVGGGRVHIGGRVRFSIRRRRRWWWSRVKRAASRGSMTPGSVNQNQIYQNQLRLFS